MTSPIRILLQTTIPFAEDGWHIGRLSLLRDELSSRKDESGNPLFEVTTGDRESGGATTPQMRFPGRLIQLSVLSVLSLAAFVSTAAAQNKIEMQTCEDLKITKKQYGINVVETATCINPTRTFKPKGTLRNVFVH